jgi:hypothetical protein
MSHRLHGILAAAALSGSACGPGATGFAGTWTYQTGSTIVSDCGGGPEQTVDLTQAAPMGRPAFFTFTASPGGEVLHEVDARGCNYTWTVNGDVAQLDPGQSCATFPDGRGGNRLVHAESGTKQLAGDAIQVDVHFATDAPSSCAIHVLGTAKK